MGGTGLCVVLKFCLLLIFKSMELGRTILFCLSSHVTRICVFRLCCSVLQCGGPSVPVSSASVPDMRSLSPYALDNTVRY